MKRLILILALLTISMSAAQADQFQDVMYQYNQYNQSLLDAAQGRPVQRQQTVVQQSRQNGYVYYQVPTQVVYQPVQQPVYQYQYPQQNQPQNSEQKNNAREMVQNATSLMHDVTYGIQSVRSMINTIKGGY